eukprot:TRINITY_DN3352_c0_g2_i2.p1 TRINITY_DN3352_c0_g2~~TRINITY_DN3352_c0_g2_i2.p1  ORF type:complete len:215 (+),score=15.88 TRINITY_DN3352_c0_g2_i2:163-807(+)
MKRYHFVSERREPQRQSFVDRGRMYTILALLQACVLCWICVGLLQNHYASIQLLSQINAKVLDINSPSSKALLAKHTLVRLRLSHPPGLIYNYDKLKHVIYLIQGPDFNDSRFQTMLRAYSSERSDIIFLSTDVPIPSDFNGTAAGFDAFYCEGCSWAKGRNRLVTLAEAKEKERGWNYYFFIMADLDVDLVCSWPVWETNTLRSLLGLNDDLT